MRNYLVWIIGALSACDAVSRNPEFCGDGFCSEPDLLPFCDKDGTIGPKKQPDTCIAVDCQPGEFIACRGNETIACNSSGDNYDVLECASGCIQGSATCTPCSPGETRCRESFLESCGASGTFQVAKTCDVTCNAGPTPHCAYIEPKYIPDSCDEPATQDSFAFVSATFDTDGSNCTGGIIAQTGGPDICVVRAKSITVPQGVTATIVGSRALALIGDDSVEVAGTLDVSARLDVNGPGANTTTTGRGGNVVGTTSNAAGGAGFATAGAPGGTTTTVGGANNGGAPTQNPALLTTLLGGSQGGGLGSLGASGGGGGGAAMLVACRGGAVVSGTIIAGGGGAKGAVTVMVGMLTEGSPGYGGGSGGNVVIQGITVEVTGRLFANGGGGGSGNDNFTTSGNAGNNGSELPANGGPSSRNNGAGGGGGSVAQGPVPGNPPVGGLPRTPGGGGGSVGFLQTYTPKNIPPTLNPTAQSPNLQPNLEARTR